MRELFPLKTPLPPRATARAPDDSINLIIAAITSLAYVMPDYRDSRR